MAEQTVIAGNEAGTEGGEGQATQGTEAAGQQEELVLEKDPRWEKEWKKDPNNLYKTIKGYDKSFTPAQQLIKKYGYKEFSELDPILEEYKTLKDPQNPNSVIVNLLNEWSGNPELYQKISESFKEWDKSFQESNVSKVLGTAPGGQITPQMIELMNQVKDLTNFKNEITQKQENQKNYQEFETVLSGLKEITTQYGVKDYDELKFLQEFKAANLPVSKIEGYFLKTYLPKIVESAKTNTQASVINNITKNKLGGGIAGGKPGKPSTKEPTLQEELKPIIARLLNRQ